MSSINSDAAIQIHEFFDRELLPVATGLRESDRILFPTSAESHATSYYLPRTKTTMARAAFELGDLTTVQHLEEAMRKLWIAQDYHAVVPLAPSLARIASHVRLRAAQA